MFPTNRLVIEHPRRPRLRSTGRSNCGHAHILGSVRAYKKTSGIRSGSNPGSAPRLEKPHIHRLKPPVGAVSSHILHARGTIAHRLQGVNERVGFSREWLLFLTFFSGIGCANGCHRQATVRNPRPGMGLSPLPFWQLYLPDICFASNFMPIKS